MQVGDWLVQKMHPNADVYKLVSVDGQGSGRIEPKQYPGYVFSINLDVMRVATTDEYFRAFRNIAGAVQQTDPWVDEYKKHQAIFRQVYGGETAPKTESKETKHDCTTMGHKWTPYVGFTEAYETCKCCPAKRGHQ